MVACAALNAGVLWAAGKLRFLQPALQHAAVALIRVASDVVSFTWKAFLAPCILYACRLTDKVQPLNLWGYIKNAVWNHVWRIPHVHCEVCTVNARVLA